MVICGDLSFLRIFCLSLLSEFAWTFWSECRWCCDMNNKVVLKCRRDVTVCMNFLELECGWQCDMWFCDDGSFPDDMVTQLYTFSSSPSCVQMASPSSRATE